MEFVIISGLSGAGKSRAASIMEDMGFFCVDNLPAPLIPKFAELGMAGNGEYDRVVLVTDIRGGTRFDSLFQALDGLRAMQCAYSILFMEATDEVIIQRYKETRRSHPLADECDSLEEAIALERRMLSPLRERAAHIIDTSGLTARGLRAKLLQLFARGPAERSMEVRVTPSASSTASRWRLTWSLMCAFCQTPTMWRSCGPAPDWMTGCGTMPCLPLRARSFSAA